MFCLQRGTGAKNAFLKAKEFTAKQAASSGSQDPFSKYIRYKIYSTELFTEEEAFKAAQSISSTPTSVRPNCLLCLLVEDNHYLFFIPTRLTFTKGKDL
jgi:hypothetical protein